MIESLGISRSDIEDISMSSDFVGPKRATDVGGSPYISPSFPFMVRKLSDGSAQTRTIDYTQVVRR